MRTFDRELLARLRAQVDAIQGPGIDCTDAADACDALETIAADVDTLLQDIMPAENPRERGDDDGKEYGDPRDHRDGRE